MANGRGDRDNEGLPFLGRHISRASSGPGGLGHQHSFSLALTRALKLHYDYARAVGIPEKKNAMARPEVYFRRAE